MSGKPFTIFAFGDSVVWGEGLNEKDKFVSIVARRLAKRIGRKAVVHSFAHAGAAIRDDRKAMPFSVAEKSKAHSYENEPRFVHGEIGQLLPTIHTQIRIASGEKAYAEYLDPHPSDISSHRARKLGLKGAVEGGAVPDLIILNGGVNDFRTRHVFAPFADEVRAKSDAPIVSDLMKRLSLHGSRGDYLRAVRRCFHGRLKTLLGDVRQRWPETPIVVTGYYPVFTSASFEGRSDAAVPLILYAFLRMKRLRTPPARSLKGYVELYTRFGKEFLTERSALFDEASCAAMRKACDETHVEHAPVIFAAPEFGPKNGAFAKDAWLFGWETVELDLKDIERMVDILSADDPMEDERKRAVDVYLKHFKSELSFAAAVERKERAYRNSVAHPNRKGAKAYADAVTEAIVRSYVR